ncbi:MAG: toll/interleukin-1 receptor domain-containing protein [Gemmatimonadales bacterium]
MPAAPVVAPMFFISYRRDDSAGHVGRLYDALSARFGRNRLFFDLDHIAPGQDFVQVLDNSLNRCSVLLVVIGKRWAGSGRIGSRRIDQPDDFVHIEVAAGLRRTDLRVIPVLIQGTKMPGPTALPDDLKDLARRNATEISDLRWKEDVARLCSSLEAGGGVGDPAGEALRRFASGIRIPQKLPAWAKPAGLAAAVLLVVGLAVAAFQSRSHADGVATAEVPGSSQIPRGDPLKLPLRLDQGVKVVLPVARKWRADAQLTDIEAVLPAAGASAEEYILNFSFRSPTDGAGLKVTTGSPGGLRYDQLPAIARASIRPLSDSFMNLPEAVAAAREAGMFGQLQSARLSSAASGVRSGRPTWTIRPVEAGQARAYYLDGLTGKPVAVPVKKAGGLLGKVQGIFK